MNGHFPIVIKLGGQAAVLQKLRAQGSGVARDTLRMWKARGRISSAGQRQLMRLAEAEGIAYAAADFEIGAAEAA